MTIDTFEELKALINCIQDVYTETSNGWMQTVNNDVNLKRTKVSSISENGDFYKKIIQYIYYLNESSVDVVSKFSDVCSYKVTARVKTQNSIEQKIQNYKTEKHEFGKVPIIKCLNDLFGIRVTLPQPLSFEQISAFVNRTYQDKYKCIDSSKCDYKAVHIYFKVNNWTFPWELQIWNKCDVESNLISHKAYKQAYTNWEKKNKGGGIIDG